LSSGRKKKVHSAPITEEGNQIYPYLGPQFRASGLIKYGAVKVIIQVRRKPIAEETPNV